MLCTKLPLRKAETHKEMQLAGPDAHIALPGCILQRKTERPKPVELGCVYN